MQRGVRVSREALELHGRSFVIDLHTDTLMAAQMTGRDLAKRHRPPAGFQPWMLHADIPRLLEGGLDAVAFGIVSHPWPHKAFERAQRNLRHGLMVIERNSDRLALATSCAGIGSANVTGRLAVLFGVEGMHMLSGRLENIATLYEMGARYITLAHFTSNRFAASSADPLPRPQMNPLLEEAVREMNSLGMIVDVAHAHPRDLERACRLSSKPVIVSHGAAAALRPTFRNLTDDDIRLVAGTGGVIGIIFAAGWLTPAGRPAGLDSVVDHADHVRKLVGIEHVALGSDWDGFIAVPREMPDAAALPVLTQLFLDRGYTPEDTEKVLGANFLRVFREVCG
jgi:membrane dipeptidase